MRCPNCSSLDNKVVDSRLGKEGETIRRRRECLKCEARFTTYERIEETLPSVIKKDGRREPYDRMKILNGLKKACEKRPIGMEMLEKAVETIEKTLQEKGLKEIPSTVIGEEVMNRLHALDEVAYVRFASVYRSFRDINEFMSELKDILNTKEAKALAKETTPAKEAAPAKQAASPKEPAPAQKPAPVKKQKNADAKEKEPEKLRLPLDS